ncbi:MAG TPA: nucleotidyl transferase AbiEii/AbiGii toxin family protein [Bacillota bacterium]|nr:nucleotidyl transferase AbiEii/AbiGii toxin family protein [Bacillota bacterium]
MFAEATSAAQLALLDRLGERKLLEAFYMAGGTAAALQLGHRRSEDFDFFSSEEQDFGQKAMALAGSVNFVVSNSGPGALHGLVDDIRLSFLVYRYPLLFPTVMFRGVALADLREIALMKLVAVANRGSRKDFVDLFFICRQVTGLRVLVLDLFPRKFRGRLYSVYHLIRSLQYFDDAEREPPLDMLQPLSWTELKQFFIGQAEQLTKENLTGG